MSGVDEAEDPLGEAAEGRGLIDVDGGVGVVVSGLE